MKTLEQFLETEPAYTKFVLPHSNASHAYSPSGHGEKNSPSRSVASAAAAIRVEYDNAADEEIISDLTDELIAST